MDLRTLLTPRALLWTLVAVLCVVLLVTASTSTAAFSVFNPSWDGASGVQTAAEEEGIETQVAQSTAVYDEVEPNETVAVVIGPQERYTPAELASIRAFVDQGGTLIVADDFGDGNQLLSGVGVEARLDGRLLRDPRNYEGTTAMPIATVVTNDSAVSVAESVQLNHGTVVEEPTGTVLARSSEFSYLDSDRDGEIDETESIESYPVAVREEFGTGAVITVSDGSLFINAMLERADNDAFTRGLLTESSLVVLDTTHTSATPPLHAALLALRSSTLLQGALLLLLGVVGYLLPTVSRAFR
ncbi:DUF4350 domain-containing protein [Halobellus rufus]|uniref:DUF4350 domain-containing protein n=1 Tax=Halobellus rufus TaxID=1448860 RepID=UPI000678D051|nr:DUF4350 domain-containing protein [Halobellus rufus]